MLDSLALKKELGKISSSRGGEEAKMHISKTTTTITTTTTTTTKNGSVNIRIINQVNLKFCKYWNSH